MRHLKKYNESTEHPSPYTWDELIYLIEGGEVKLIRCEKDEVLDAIKGYLNRISNPTNSNRSWYNPDINTSTITKGAESRMEEIFGELVLVFDDSAKPVAIMSEYEMMNPFVFGDIVICPGRDSITCYNYKTKEHTREHIR